MLRQTPPFALPSAVTERVEAKADRIRIGLELKLKLDLALRNWEIAKTARISGPWPSPSAQREPSREPPLAYSLLSLQSKCRLLHTALDQHHLCRPGQWHGS